MTTYREGTLYVQKATLRRLKLIRDADLGPKMKDLATGEISSPRVTLDQIAEIFLNTYIEQNFPEILKAERIQREADESALSLLKNSVRE